MLSPVSQLPLSQLLPPVSARIPPPFYKRPVVPPLPQPDSFNFNEYIHNLNVGNEGNLFIPFPSPYEEVSVIYPDGYVGNVVAPIVPVPLDPQRVYIVPTPFGSTRPIQQQQPSQLVPLPTSTYRNTATVPPMFSNSISPTSQNIPRPISPPIRPTTRNILPPIPPLATSPLSPPKTNNYLDEDYQMKLAITQSMNNISQRYDDDESIENALLEEAIKMSLEASNQAKTANYYANRVNTSMDPIIPQVLSPRNDSRLIISQQEKEYQESLLYDRKRKEEAELAAQAALASARASEEAARLVQVAQQRERFERSQFAPPTLVYPIESSTNNDIIHLRFRLPTGSIVNHSFNRYEPLRTLYQQLRFDMRSNDNFTLSIPPRTIITCSEDTSLYQCGIENRTIINVF